MSGRSCRAGGCPGGGVAPHSLHASHPLSVSQNSRLSRHSIESRANGSGGNAGEIGHSPVEWEGLLCACGQRGCLEAYAGGAAWIQRLAEVTPDDSRVAALAGGREHARPEHVVAAAREGDAFALAEMERYNDYMSRAIAALVFVLAPEVVILGTIPTHAGEELCFAPLRAKVASHVWPQLGGALEIVPSALGDDLPAYAGLCAAIEGLSPG